VIPHDWDDDPDYDPDEPSEPADEAAEDLSILPDDDGPPAVARTSEGTTMRLTGPEAGSLLEADASDDGSTRVVATIPTRDQALTASGALLLVHHPWGAGDLVPGALARIVVELRGQLALGVVANLPRQTATAAESWLATCVPASVHIADPQGFRLDDPTIRGKAPTEKDLRRWPYLGEDPLDVDQVLDVQRAVGANVLLSPGRAVDPSDPQASLDSVFAEADTALAALDGGERLALNLTLPMSWLTRPALRDQLLAQLLDQEQFDVWYVRVQWPSTLETMQQPLDVELLQGYKRLAQLAADEERRLLLPQTGLTGWLQLAFGATGFGAGLPGSDHAFKEPRGGGTGAPPIERYFEPSLLHAVERTAHDALRAQPGYVPCDCPYCPALHGSAEWRPRLAQLHHLHWTARLTAAATTARGGPASEVRRTVEAAVRAAEGQPLAGISHPRQLAVWDRLL
jgi:hypothetical protein